MPTDIFGTQVKDGDYCLRLPDTYGEPFGIWKGKTIRRGNSAIRCNSFMIVNKASIKELQKKLEAAEKLTKEREQERKDCAYERQKQTCKLKQSALQVGRIYCTLTGYCVYIGLSSDGGNVWLLFSPWGMEEATGSSIQHRVYKFEDPHFTVAYDQKVINKFMYRSWSTGRSDYHLSTSSIRRWKKPSIIRVCGWMDEGIVRVLRGVYTELEKKGGVK